MELPTEIWREIVSYNCESVYDCMKKEKDLIKLQNYAVCAKRTHDKIIFEIKQKIKLHDIIKITQKKNTKWYSCIDGKYGIVCSREKRDTNHDTIKILELNKCKINGRFGFWELPLDQSTIFNNYSYYHNWYNREINLSVYDIEILQSKNDIINHNRLIASSLKYDDVIEYVPCLFCPHRHRRTLYARVNSKDRTKLKIEELDELNNVFGDENIIDTKCIVRKLKIDEFNDCGLNHFHYLFHKRNLNKCLIKLNSKIIGIKNKQLHENIKMMLSCEIE
tara:strand:+ start:46 stop:879 length:834 start_codon:yes stop_codon:yes gene_type:complete